MSDTVPLFRDPWVLVVAVPAAAGVLFAARAAREGLPAGRRRAGAGLRALALLLAAAAAAGPHRVERPPRERQLLVAVHGASPLPVPSPAEGEDLVVAGGADPSGAVAAALARRRPGCDARLVLATSGEDGDPAASERALRGASDLGVPVFVLPLPAPSRPPRTEPPAPWLRGIRVPPGIAGGVPFRPEPDLDPAADPAAVLVEFRVDGRDAGRGPASAGLPEIVLSAGPHGIAARATDATGRPRGEVVGTVLVPGPPSVLLLEEGEDPSPFARAAAGRGIPMHRAAPGEAHPPYEAFSVVVLGPGATGDAALEDAVRAGRGLLVLGGPEEGAGEGLGRLRGTPVAAALPIFLPPPPPPRPEPPPAPPPEETPPPPGDDPGLRVDEGERPGAVISLLLVVDSSGSMQGLKLEMARRAAAAAAATLSAEDRFGLLSFTESPRWDLPLGPAGDASRLREALRVLAAGGGTDLLPALREARRALRGEETAVRHCLVLSDGETPPFGLKEVVEAMVGEGATLSSIGIGADYDARLLGSLSQWGKGRTYPAIDPATLPEVVTLDTRRVVAAGAEARRGTPAPDLPAPPREKPPEEPERRADPPPAPPPPPDLASVEEHEPAALIEGLGPWPPARPPASPPLPRRATTVALRFAGEGGPALVLGRHGLGRTAVLVVDPADWAGWEGLPPAALRVLRGLAPAPPASPVEVLGVEPGPEGTTVTFESRGEGEEEEGFPPPRVEGLRPAGDAPSALPVRRVGARRFRTLLPPAAPGFRTLVVGGGGPGEPGVPVGLFDPGPPPPDPPDPEAPARLAAAAGVPLLEGPLPPPPPPRPGEPRRVPLAPWLAAAAVLAFVADTAVRRWGGSG